MGFFDTVKDVAGKVDGALQKQMERLSDSQIREALSKNPNNKAAQKEAERRGL